MNPVDVSVVFGVSEPGQRSVPDQTRAPPHAPQTARSRRGHTRAPAPATHAAPPRSAALRATHHHERRHTARPRRRRSRSHLRPARRALVIVDIGVVTGVGARSPHASLPFALVRRFCKRSAGGDRGEPGANRLVGGTVVNGERACWRQVAAAVSGRRRVAYRLCPESERTFAVDCARLRWITNDSRPQARRLTSYLCSGSQREVLQLGVRPVLPFRWRTSVDTASIQDVTPHGFLTRC